MPTIDGSELPEPIAAALEDHIARAAPDVLVIYARNHPEAIRGFQLKKSSAPHIRKYLLNRFRDRGELDTSLKTFLAGEGFNNSFVAVLSETVLKRYFSELLHLYGHVRFISGLLLDDREDVRRLPLDYLEKHGGELPEHEEGKPGDLLQILGPFIGYVTDKIPDSALGEANRQIEDLEAHITRWKNKVSKTEQQLQDVRSKLKSLQKTRGRATAADSGKQALEKEQQVSDELRRALENEKQRRKRVEEELRRSNDEFQSLRERMEDIILERLRESVNSLTRSWLKQPLRVEREAERIGIPDGNDDLLPWVDDVLERQAVQDRHSGNRRVIGERLNALKKALSTVRKTRAESLNPLPELSACEDRIEQEIHALNDTLGGEEGDEDRFVSALMARINDPHAETDLKKTGRLLRLLEDMDVLAVTAVRKLYSRYHAAMARVYDAYSPEQPDEGLPDDPVWRLRRAVGSNTPFMVLLDGHNVLYALPDLFGLHPESDAGRQTEGRNLLTAMVVGLFGSADRCEAVVYFDGPERSGTALRENVKVTYSGGTGRDRADKAIIEYLEYLRRSEPDKPVLVVSDDRELQRQVESYGAKPISTRRFGALLDELP